MDSDDLVLYVGKAKDLSKRIGSYRQASNLSPSKATMVAEAVKVKFQVFSSELEALLAEAELVHQHQPRYNILLKDDKSPIYVVITRDDFPRVLTARRREIDKGKIKGDIYGPFQSAYMLGKVMRTIRPIFRWCSRPGGKTRAKPCFYHHLDMCSGACIGQVSSRAYRADINRLRGFLRGKTTTVLRQLKKDIEQKSQQQKFEQAQLLRQQFDAIVKVTDPAYRLAPDVALPRLRSESGLRSVQILQEIVSRQMGLGSEWFPHRIECYDVSNLQGKLATVSMVVFVDGVVDSSQYRIFHVRRLDSPDDYAMLRQALKRRQNHPEWGKPDLILIDGGRGQLNAAYSVWQFDAPVTSITKRPDRLVLRQPDGKFSFHPITELGLAGDLLQQLRDEAHRFAKKHVHKRLAKRDLQR